MYRTRWETLNPAEKWTESLCGHDWYPEVIAVSGVLGLCWEEFVKFFTLGSISRGIPRREWDIPFKGIQVHAFAFYPRADVLAIAGNENEEAPWE